MENLSNLDGEYALPNRTTVRSYLEDLIAERRSREEVADWATQFILGDYDHIEVTDEAAWEMLKTLAGADLKASPREYLHVKKEFEDWMEELAIP